MEEKINIAQLLKDCPKGMELDCTMYDYVQFDSVLEGKAYPIKLQTPDGQVSLNKYGCYSNNKHAKCVIFPIGKTTWEGFRSTFNDGDIVSTSDGEWVGITTGGISNKLIPTYCVLNPVNKFHAYFDEKETWQFYRLATEEEKQKLFQAIKDNGYHWNAETKTLEKLVEPKFKVGDKIEKLGYRFTIIQVKDNNYLTKCGNKIPIDNQDDFILVPNKFDITTLKPFDKVLIRDSDTQKWGASLFSYCNGLKSYKYSCINGSGFKQCIPYKGNEYLLGTTEDCDEYYKTWE